MNEKIDFVICWVDGNDENWQNEKSKYNPQKNTDNRIIRYRDWDNLQYWFRGVEKYANWVNKIHFVTWGHVPEWLNTEHPKLNVVKHEEYIPERYLPTFSARPIEINLHRIPGLSEKFVYFNDDMFLLNKLTPEDFFIKGKPCDTAALDIAVKRDEVHATSVFNSLLIINKHFNKKDSIKNNFGKWYNFKNGYPAIKTLLLTPWNLFTGFNTPHLPNSFNKKTFEEVWEKEKNILEETSTNKFRKKTDVTQYLFKFWQLASGNFVPRKKIGRFYRVTNNINEVKNAIEHQREKIICINDTDDVKDFENYKEEIIKSFDKVFVAKSSFEL